MIQIPHRVTVACVFFFLSGCMAFRTPTSVLSQDVDPDTTYDEVLAWWHSSDHTATVARNEVARGSAICFVYLGGSDEVLVCAPPGQCAVQACRQVRGRRGTALLMTYAV